MDPQHRHSATCALLPSHWPKTLGRGSWNVHSARDFRDTYTAQFGTVTIVIH